MKIEIEYCSAWNYLPQATSLMEKIKKETDFETKLIPSGGGVFEVTVDGSLLYSKKRTGQFPLEKDLVSQIKNL